MSPDASAERATPPSAPRPHLVQLGLPGSGKSTVGPLVAARLGRPFVDLDAAIVARTGMPIATLFAREGEETFREWERRLTAEFAPVWGPPIVLAPGAGWIEDPGHRARLGVSMVGVLLRVSPEVAVARMGRDAAARPLVAGPDPVGAVAALQARREALYLQANHEVRTDSVPPDEVASFIVALASRETGD